MEDEKWYGTNGEARAKGCRFCGSLEGNLYVIARRKVWGDFEEFKAAHLACAQKAFLEPEKSFWKNSYLRLTAWRQKLEGEN